MLPALEQALKPSAYATTCNLSVDNLKRLEACEG